MKKESTACKVSAIVPVYNVDRYLKQCLNSILRQTLKSFEAIVIEEGWTDSSPEICDNYAKTDSRIKVFHTQNKGYAAACNKALESCSGDYIALIEPDDFIDERMFEDLYRLAEDSNADIVKSAFWEFTDTPKKRREKFRGLDIGDFGVFKIEKHPEIFSAHPSIWSCIYKRSFLLDSGITFKSGEIRGWEDNLFQVATMCAAQRIVYTGKAYYHWRKTYLLDYEKISNPQMPMLRSIEICSFLKSKGVNNPDILACLLRRSIVYLKLSYESASFADLPAVFRLTQSWCDAAQISTASKSVFFKNTFRLFAAKRFPPALYVYFKIKLFIKKISKRLGLG